MQTHFAVGTQSLTNVHNFVDSNPFPVVVNVTGTLSLHLQSPLFKATHVVSVVEVQVHAALVIATSVMSSTFKHFLSLLVFARHVEFSGEDAVLYTKPGAVLQSNPHSNPFLSFVPAVKDKD